jgi:hypothetical protein
VVPPEAVEVAVVDPMTPGPWGSVPPDEVAAVAGAVGPGPDDPATGNAEAAAARIAAPVAEMGLAVPVAWARGTAETVVGVAAPAAVVDDGAYPPGLDWDVGAAIVCGIGVARPEEGPGAGLNGLLLVPEAAPDDGLAGLGPPSAVLAVPPGTAAPTGDAA